MAERKGRDPGRCPTSVAAAITATTGAVAAIAATLTATIGAVAAIAATTLAPGIAEAATAVPTLVEPVAMRDGVTLATDVFLPAGSEGTRLPTLLRRTPYGRALDDGFTGAIGALGYAVVSQDVRGRGDSAGTFRPFFDDRVDGPDTIAWIAAQPWSDGRVGTWGGSAEGVVQLMALPDAPDALLCANPQVATADVYDGMMPGGAWRKELSTEWLTALKATDVLADWRAHEAGDAYWDPARLDDDEIGRVRAQVLLVGGFYDIFAIGTPRTHARLQSGATPGARDGQYLVLGPWTHGGIDAPSDGSPRVEGDVSYPPAAGYRDLWWDFLDFFDACLRDGPRPTWAPVRYARTTLANDGRTATIEWRTTDAWPPPSREAAMHLLEDDSLSPAGPRPDGASAALPVDPASPVPSKGGGNLTTPAGPFDQSTIDALPGVLFAQTPVATTPVRIEGNVRATIWAASSTDDGDVVVRLSQATPSGRVVLLTDGILRGRFAAGTGAARPLQPGVPTRFDVDLGPVAIDLPAGHALRVSIAGTSSPRYEPNPGTSAPLSSDPSPTPSTLTVYRDASHPSTIALPVTAGALPGEVILPPEPADEAGGTEPADTADAATGQDEAAAGDRGSDAADQAPGDVAGADVDVASAAADPAPCGSRGSGCVAGSRPAPIASAMILLAVLGALGIPAKRKRTGRSTVNV